MSRDLPILINVDVEPNDREVEGDRDNDWTATEPCIARIEEFRERVQQSTGRAVHLNWYLRLDPQVAIAYGRSDYACVRFREVWARCLDAGDSIGLHVHAWRLRQGKWVADHGDHAWVRHCIHTSCETFRQHFGCTPQTFRFGDRFCSNDVIRCLDELGVAYDLTVEPGRPGGALNESSTGSLPNYRRAPRRPYRPSRLNYLRPGRFWSRRLWIVPLSTGHADGQSVVPSNVSLSHLNLAVDPGWMCRVFDRLLDRVDTTHIAWVSRTGDYAVDAHRANFHANFAHLADHAGRGSFRYVRPNEIWAESA